MEENGAGRNMEIADSISTQESGQGCTLSEPDPSDTLPPPRQHLLEVTWLCHQLEHKCSNTWLVGHLKNSNCLLKNLITWELHVLIALGIWQAER